MRFFLTIFTISDRDFIARMGGDFISAAKLLRFLFCFFLLVELSGVLVARLWRAAGREWRGLVLGAIWPFFGFSWGRLKK